MRSLNSAPPLALICILAVCTVAYSSTVTGTYAGTVQLTMLIPALGTEMTDSGTAEITVSDMGAGKYQVHIKTKVPSMPESDETREYTLSGDTLSLNEVEELQDLRVVHSGSLTVSGTTMTGTISTVGTVGGQVQTSQTASFNLTRQ